MAGAGCPGRSVLAYVEKGPNGGKEGPSEGEGGGGEGGRRL